MIKAIFFDVDGTLLSFNTHQIPESTYEALRLLRQKGIKTFVATGRQWIALSALDDIPFDGYLTLNGSYCLAGKDQVIYKRLIPQEDVRAFIHYQEKVEAFPCMFLGEHDMNINFTNEQTFDLFKLLDFQTVPEAPIRHNYDREILQMVAFFPESKEQEIMRRLPGCENTRWHPAFADIIPAHIDKAIGIEKVGEYFGFTPEEAMAFGDGGNDMGMIRRAGIGVAMGNANEEVQAVADHVTTTVDDNGVWNALRHFGII